MSSSIKGSLLHWHNLGVAIKTSINCYVTTTTSISVKQYPLSEEVGLLIAQTVILISTFYIRVWDLCFRISAVVRAIVSLQCGLGSIPARCHI